MTLETYLADQRARIETALQTLIDRLANYEGRPFRDHFSAMRYSLLAGGKRLRPILCIAGAQAIQAEAEHDPDILPIAAALECIHTYSLIHDDLPAMDDDDLRRGKPTSHVKFGEAGAILAGDGLLTLAFELLSQPDNDAMTAETRLQISHTVARAAGSIGMVGGQSLDILHEGQPVDLSLLQTIHRAKTGALITAAVVSGGLAAGASKQQISDLTCYGDRIGLAFQIIDDLLDVESTTEQLGKAAGSDAERGKATYPALLGVEKTKQLAQDTIDEALTALSSFSSSADPLRMLAHYIINRSH